MIRKKVVAIAMAAAVTLTIIPNNFTGTLLVQAEESAMEANAVEENITEENMGQVVEIPDSRLKEAINATLDKSKDPEAQITVAEMKSLTKLDTAVLPFIGMSEGQPNRGVKDITGLEYATNLTYLDLSENEISDLRPIQNLTNLTYLELDRNMLGDITPLSNLVNLVHLNIYNNTAITDTTAISGLENLEWLDLHFANRGKEKVNVVPLGKLTKLKYLNFESNHITDISFVKTLSNIEEIGVGANHILDMSPLSALIQRAWVDWDGAYVGMYGQILENPVNIDIDYKENTFKIEDPVKGLDEYMAANEATPEASIMNGQENENVSAKYNAETKEVEITIKENPLDTAREIKTAILLDYGFYTLTMNINIKQDISPIFKKNVVLSNDGNGKVMINGLENNALLEKGHHTVSVMPNEGYELDKLYLNDKDITEEFTANNKDGAMDFEVLEDGKFHATFKKFKVVAPDNETTEGTTDGGNNKNNESVKKEDKVNENKTPVTADNNDLSQVAGVALLSALVVGVLNRRRKLSK
ncbi:Leucine Rich repeat-containing protein [Clostridium collagenovorans DSM 3089]|uniref:Leucine Rich repeat-containing protein n=1 Tax=Clostridium collagenovorans DSM 3089 TaxID=1121306 RepID=A0A1M5WNN8_9CLOT|nr:leucine-rich repeat domain-containing protein [Clostridium collagenovorans]SHH89117.1 Leucine Rich repeat-containing protein [Clostridium collagenovorans DSM 3089]